MQEERKVGEKHVKTDAVAPGLKRKQKAAEKGKPEDPNKRQRVDESSASGCLFGSVTSPHYFFEMLSWAGFNVATGAALPGVVFMTFGALVMTCYAIVRHEAAQRASPSKAHVPVFPFGIDVRPPQAVIEALA